jgi:ureidoacrylate peracid hydrolase
MSEALLVIDFINDIVSPDGKVAKFGTPVHAEEQNAIANANRAIEQARQKGSKVIWIRVCFEQGHPELANAKAPFYIAHRENDWLVKGTWGTEFHADLLPRAADEVLLEKSRINPFTNPQLEAELDGIERVVLTGVATNLAVEETVRNAAARDLEVVVLEDCCASNNQEMHDFAVTSTFPKFARVSSSAEYAAEN